MHGDNDIREKLVGKRLGLVAGHGSEAACGNHEHICAKQLRFFIIRQHAAQITHVYQLIPVPIEDMYLVFPTERTPACIVEAIDNAYLIRAGSCRAGELYAITVIVAAVLMAYEHCIRLCFKRRIVGVNELIRINDDTVAVMADFKARMSEPLYFHDILRFQKV